jgi:hypothetical protein
MIGDVVEGCMVAWLDPPETTGQPPALRKVDNATARHAGANIVEIGIPHTSRIIRKKLNGGKMIIRTPDGRDLVADWKE